MIDALDTPDVFFVPNEATPTGDALAPIAEISIPTELAERPQWVCWRIEAREGKPTKVPYQVSGMRADTTDPTTWTTYNAASCAAADGRFAGIGFVFTKGDPYTGIDLDRVRNPDTGLLTEEAAAIIERLPSYTEISPSGSGVHIIVKARKPGTRCRTGNIEMYDSGRFFVMTGEHLPGTPTTIEDRQADVDALYGELFPSRPAWSAPRAPQQVDLADSGLLDRMLAAPNGAQIKALWQGDTSNHPSASEADEALCMHLAFWTDRDAVRMDAFFRQSDLFREKWDSRRGETTYGAITIAKAIGLTPEGYRAATWEASGRSTRQSQPGVVRNAKAPLTDPDLTAVGDGYRLTWPCGIDATVERIGEYRGDLMAEVTIRSSRQSRPEVLHSTRLKLMSSSDRKCVADLLDNRESELDWPGMLGQLCVLVRERYRAGEPSIDMRQYVPETGPRWLLEPFVERGGPTVIFADGGTAKSIMAATIAASLASGKAILGHLHVAACPVLYLDWETDGDTFYERLHAICAGVGLHVPPVFYRRQVASLAESAHEIRREIERMGAGFVVVDSLGAARGGEPESADVTIRTFNAARSLGVPWLGIDHVTKVQGNNGKKPFGSAYTHNGARLTWAMDKVEEDVANSIVVSLTNHKRNNGRFLPARGYRIEFERDAADRLLTVRFGQADLASVPGLTEKLSVSKRIEAQLRSGPQSISDIAEAIDVPVKQVSARVGEMVKAGRLVRLEDDRVALKAKEAA